MIPSNELRDAIALALAAASAPQGKETPLSTSPATLDVVCFEFWHDDTLRVVGTNGRRLAMCSFGVPKGLQGKYLLPLDRAVTLLIGLNDNPGVEASLTPIDHTQLMVAAGGYADIFTSVGVSYPEYAILLSGDSDTTKDAVYDLAVLQWCLENLAPFTEGENRVALHVRLYGPTILKPMLRASYKALSTVMLALKPAYTW